MLKDTQYLVILPFMVEELNLKGNELLVYACIHGFSNTEGQEFTGSLKHLQAWTGATKQGVLKTLRSLCEKGLIQKNETFLNGFRVVSYRSTEFTPGKLSLPGGGSTEFTTGKLGFTGGGKLSLPTQYIKDYNKDNNNNIGGRFTPPSIQEVTEYCASRGNGIDPQRFVDYYQQQGWKLSNGNPMKDWRAAVRTWESRNPHKINHELDEVF